MTNTIEKTDYQKQANDFLTKTGATLTIEFLKNGKHFEDDKENRDIYKCTLKRGTREYTFHFGQSLDNSGFYYQYKTGTRQFPLDRKYLAKDYFKRKSLGLIGIIKMKDSAFTPSIDIIHYPTAPTAYDILACLQKYEVGTFENFCGDFGYDTDSIKAHKVYKAVENEYLNISRLFNEPEIEELQEIN
jgi:hypothetical protein